MRAFILSLLLFAIILTGVFFHARYVTSLSEQLLGYVTKLRTGEDLSATLWELSSFWEKSNKVLEWTSRRKEPKSIRETIMALQVAYAQDDRSSFAYRTEQLAELATDLERFEQIPFFSDLTE